MVTTAHHTQFTNIGWKYLAHNAGSGNLTGNGTYVTYVSPDLSHLTMVIETMVCEPRYTSSFLY